MLGKDDQLGHWTAITYLLAVDEGLWLSKPEQCLGAITTHVKGGGMSEQDTFWNQSQAHDSNWGNPIGWLAWIIEAQWDYSHA